MIDNEQDRIRNEAALASPGLITLGGRSFLCTKPSGPMMNAWRAELRRQVQQDMADPIRECNREIAEMERAGTPLSPTMMKEMTAMAFASKVAKSKKVEPTIEQITEQTQSVEGIRFWAWLVLRKADPSLPKEWIDQNLPTEEEAFQIASDLAQLTLLPDLVPN